MPQATQINSSNILDEINQTTGNSSYLSPVLSVAGFRFLKVELTNIAFTGGSTPVIQLLLQDMLQGGTVGAGFVAIGSLAAGAFAVILLGEGLGATSVNSYLSAGSTVMGFAKMTHCQIQVNVSGTPTTAQFHSRVLGFI